MGPTESECGRPRADRGLLEELVRDGRPLLHLAGLGLILAGLFVLLLSARRPIPRTVVGPPTLSLY